MRHLGARVLHTPRLILRPFREEDAEAMFRNWASDPQVTKFLTWPTHANVEVSRGVLKDWVEKYADPAYYQWAIVPDDGADAPIGSIAVVDQKPELDLAQIGYCIGRPWWRRGITSEALAGVLDFLFDEVGFHRIEAVHDANNPHSGGVMRKCGLRYEGTLRSAGRNNQGICDLCVYALLKEDRKGR